MSTSMATCALVSLALSFASTARADSGPDLVIDALAFDPVGQTVTLPLFEGRHDGAPVWYVLLDSSDEDDAENRGVNYSPKLANALGTWSVQAAWLDGGLVDFPGTVDFSATPSLVPGPTVFPPAAASPGSFGDADYSPLVTIGDGIVHNAPQVANATGLHDKVLAIDYTKRTVTLALTEGRYHGKPILYVSTDASDLVAATLEGATYAPNLDDAPGLGVEDPEVSARAAIIPVVNGITGVGDPDRQGLVSAILGEGSPLNITVIHPRNKGSIPTYSPLWDVHPAVWTDDAYADGVVERIEHHEDVIDFVEEGYLVSGGAGPENESLSGLRAAGFLVNCPVVAVE